MKSLYSKDSKGNMRIWNIFVVGDKIIQTSGLVGGKCVKNEKICKGKNIGKSNETTPQEQAKLEADATYNCKLTEGYFKTIKEANEEEVILPMLAKTFGDHEHKIDWEVDTFVQPKLDGMRCLAIIKDGNVLLKSRDGKIIDSSIVKHIVDELESIKEDVILDGELYAHGESFQENMRLIKKYRVGETEKVHYHTYDLISSDSFCDRYKEMADLVNGMRYINSVKTDIIKNKKELNLFHTCNIRNGYEGSIVRWGPLGYKVNGRSEALLKYKDFQDMALKIVDVIPSEQRPAWGQFIFKLKGKEFSCGMKFSHAEREEILKNKNNYIGKTGELRYFELSEDGIPRFPVCIGFREDVN